MSARYPRSLRLPWSPGGDPDDGRLADAAAFVGPELCVTEKCDGVNLAYTAGSVFSRSHAGPPAHESFAVARATHARIGPRVAQGISVFCAYSDASLVFGVRDDARGTWWDWDRVAALAVELGLPTVPVLFRGVVGSERELERLTTSLAAEPSAFGGARAGVVVRLAGAFPDAAFAASLATWVRPL